MSQDTRGRMLAAVVAAQGVVMLGGGAAAWFMVRRQLVAERITVPDDADMLGGRPVTGPLTAYAQAQVIDKHLLDSTGGRTFAELGGDDPMRDTAMSASFMRASLFTSVMAFGVSAMAMGVGLVLVLVARGLRARG